MVWACSFAMNVLCTVLVFALLSLTKNCSSTPLDDYVNKYDPSYEFKDLEQSVKMKGYTVHFVNMTSQTWLSGEFAAYPLFLTPIT